ncbi:ThiF family adenylyltransferase [Sphingomonas sp. G-3-2-10]|uniref:ThiF family adenylyltransferase n=1 Tax=Sphingomonas sp. G-3-2-10 TaxID=2728838 RepID=UPI001469FAA2|nr:ThiF family adenylyltransferase [Sphingomonas sp. G-3-2-10]NML07406.1 ThiF family adenylyltransferase [Sphingomonas sp. G-3-2-10]
MFDYAAMTTRNIGFVSEAEQKRLRSTPVFVCGVGGMGGACLMALVRAGVSRLVIADLDDFEVSNFNRQLFATLDTAGRHKAEASRDQCLRINPEAEIEVLGGDWPDHLDRVLETAKIVINGTDDLVASLRLYRAGRAHGATVIDAYAAPLPSVYVTRPGDPTPEERLGYPTRGKAIEAVTDADRAASFLREAEHVMLHSSSRHHIDLALAGEVAAGRRSRMSFAPMVITTGMLMAYEAIRLATGRPGGADCRGWFLNVHKPRVERPLPAPLAALLRPVVRRALRRMTGG